MADEVVAEGDEYPVFIGPGTNFAETFSLYEEDGVTPKPLTGYTQGFAQIRDSAGGRLLGAFTVEVDEGDEDNPGQVTLTMTAAETAAIAQSGVYDIILVHENGVDRPKFLQGPAILDPTVTQIELGS